MPAVKFCNEYNELFANDNLASPEAFEKYADIAVKLMPYLYNDAYTSNYSEDSVVRIKSQNGTVLRLEINPVNEIFVSSLGQKDITLSDETIQLLNQLVQNRFERTPAHALARAMSLLSDIDQAIASGATLLGPMTTPSAFEDRNEEYEIKMGQDDDDLPLESFDLEDELAPYIDPYDAYPKIIIPDDLLHTMPHRILQNRVTPRSNLNNDVQL